MLVHAAGLSARDVRHGTYAVVLAAQDETDLRGIEKQLQGAGIAHVAYREPDCDDQLTAIGVEPVKDRRLVKKYLSRLPLLWKNGNGTEG